MLENKNGNISETRKDRGKVTMDGLQKLTNALSNGTIPTPMASPSPKFGGLTENAGVENAAPIKFRGVFSI